MKVTKRTGGSRERLICAGMIVSDPVVAAVSGKWPKQGLFSSPWANTVGTLCVEHYLKYGKAPGKGIESLFEEWTQSADKDTIGLVEAFLSELSGEYARRKKEINTHHVIDLAGRHFTRVAAEKLKEEIESALEARQQDLEKVLAKAQSFDAVNLGGSTLIDVFSDQGLIESAYQAEVEPLIKWKGALGNFFGNEFRRDAFVCFEGPEKRGKSFWLQELCWQAMLQGRKVLYVHTGDMSKDDIAVRLASRAGRRPFEPTAKDDPVRFPVFLEHSPSSDAPAEVTFETRKFRRQMTKEEMRKFMRKYSRKPHDLIRLAVYGNDSVSAYDVLSLVKKCVREEWTPDLIVIDYADLFISPGGAEESREQVNKNWKVMRRMSQDFHTCVVTATQTKASSYDADAIDMTHFSEDKRKRAHVTASIGINQTDEEKKNEVYRLNYVVRRKYKFDRKKFVYCAACLALSNPAVLSSF